MSEFDGIVGPGVDLFVPEEVVALIRVPISIDGLAAITKAVDKEYGPGLVIRTDLPRWNGWFPLATSTSAGGE